VSVLFQNAVWAVCILNVEVGSDLKIVVSIDVIVLKSIKASFIKKIQGHSDFAAFTERQRKWIFAVGELQKSSVLQQMNYSSLLQYTRLCLAENKHAFVASNNKDHFLVLSSKGTQ
jgi:hypothetical protein